MTATEELYSYSQNYRDEGQRPWSLFLDLIDNTEGDLGDGNRRYDHNQAIGGYLEMSLLGAALVEYAANPLAIRPIIDQALAGELD